MLTQAQAADYCGIGVKTFKDVCPVKATTMRDGLSRFDRFKLDTWLDNLSCERAATIDPNEWLQGLKQSIGNTR
jgi:hypothetical protein